ncbi:MAG: protein kinase [Longimicrobiales bacterium]|nr:protein kinase [Longimicrobiales bacterium]
MTAALEGRYTTERKLGEGGMATVYLAEDLKHHRKVAIKVLRPELSVIVGAERFLAEIRTTASLQHPHILPLFDSGEADKLLFYVMPHVEGESLREKLEREHQLPVEEAVRIATNVAEALDYAHARGVIHRDIKPANILLQAGKPVIADFGIALAVSTLGGGRLTETGLSLGTPHYMSPEQATGDLGVGAATDIWALGCVLYEMLVGEPPYTGSTPQAVLGKIFLAEPASATAARKSVPAHVDATIRKALEKVPADRFTSASEFARALADAGFRHGVEESAVAGAATQGLWKRLSMGFAATTVLAVVGLVWAVADSPRPEPRALARFDVTPEEDQRLASGFGVDFALSADGSRIVYVGPAPGGGTQLWQRALQDLEAVPVLSTENAVAPALSPDGLSVAFQAPGAIRTISLRGGPPVTVAAGRFSPSSAWGSDGMIYFGRENIIYRVPAAGGEPEAVTAPTEGSSHRFPDPLPDGRGLLLTVARGAPAQSRIAVVGPEGGEVREILTGTMARYAATGHVVYATADGTLMAAPFDVRRLEVTGPSVALVEGVLVKSGSASQFALSESGTLLYRTGAGAVEELVWVSRAGEVEPVDPAWTGVFGSPALSPDGRRLAVTLPGESTTDVWVRQLDRGPSLKLTFEGSGNDYPTWTPDGGSVTFSSDQAGPTADLWTKRADGSAQAVLELDQERGLSESLWSRDAEWLIYRTDIGAPGAGDILAFRPGQDSAPVPLVATSRSERQPTLSPDGRWLAYQSNETGADEIYVVPFPNAADAKWTVSAGGGTEPAWARGGGELFYRNGLREMVAVWVETEPTFSAGPTSVLFSATEYLTSLNHRAYDVTPDDERFIMLRPVGGGGEGELILVLNFFEELRARVGS